MRTAHVSEAEFITAFHELCDETTIFAPTEKMKPIGADCAFSLELADGSPMMRGLGKIRNAWPTDDSPFGRPGIHIEMGQLTDTSKPIHAKLLAAHKASVKGRTRPAPSTHQLWGPPSGPPTEEMDVVEEPEVAELPHKITREIRGVAAPDDMETKEAKRYPDAVPATVSPAREGTVPVAVVPAPVPQPRPMSAPVSTVPPPLGAAQSAAVESTFDLDSALAAARPPKPWWMNVRVGGVFAAGLVLGLLVSLAFRGGNDTKVVAASSPPPAAATQVAAAQPPPQNCPPPADPPAALAVAEEAPAVEAPAVAKARKVTKPAPTKTAAKPAVVPTKVAKAPVAQPVATTPVATKTKVAATTKTTSKPARKKKPKVACSSLDCI